MSKIAVIAFGRMNPPTVGHEKLANKVRTVARQFKGEAMIFLSHKYHKKTDPLQYNDKVKIAIKSFGNIVKRSNSNTIIKVLQELDGKYDEIVMVAGSDRVDGFKKLLNDYNGKEYNFDKITIVSAGQRDPDADGVEGMSASKMRAFATDNDLSGFTSGLPKLVQKDAKSIFDILRKGMNLL